jgi:peptidoglycan/xylan/chitin deacetylase (PgdA/CDA1 family)
MVKHKAKLVIKELLLRTRHYQRRLKRDGFGAVAVLCYHGLRSTNAADDRVSFSGLHVTEREFESHCRFLKDACHPISLDQWQASLYGGPPLPPRPVLLTFDDGYRSVLTLAQPILQKYGIPAVVFVCSDPVENQELLWFDAAARSRGEAEVEALGKLPYAVWQKTCAKLRKVIDSDDPHTPLNVQEIKTLAAMPGIEIGGHSASHARLARASRHEQFGEVLRNRRSLEEWIGREVRAFAYPNGLPEKDYNGDSISVVKDAGYELAFTTVQAYAKDVQQLEIPRFLMLAGISTAELGHRLAYSWPRHESIAASGLTCPRKTPLVRIWDLALRR